MNVLEKNGFIKAYDSSWKDWWYKHREDGSMAQIKIRLPQHNESISCDLRKDELTLLLEYLGMNKELEKANKEISYWINAYQEEVRESWGRKLEVQE